MRTKIRFATYKEITMITLHFNKLSDLFGTNKSDNLLHLQKKQKYFISMCNFTPEDYFNKNSLYIRNSCQNMIRIKQR